MNVLVTGSSGFIGTALVDALLAGDETVGALDKLPGKTRSGAVRVFQCDIVDRDRLLACVAEFQPEIIVHLAARADIDESATVADYAPNVEGVENLLAAVAATPTVRRVIWTSSQLVGHVGYVPRHDTDYRPDTVYGKSKVRTEQLVRESDGAAREWIIARPTTVWGPGMSPHYQRLFRMIKRGIYFHVGHRPLRKSYGYIDNVVHQYLCLMRAPAEQVNRKTFYLADYEPIDLIAWCDGLQRALRGPTIRHLPRSAAKVLAYTGDALNAVGLKRFPFNSFRLRNVLTEYIFDTSATQQVCGPLPVTAERGVEATAAWFQGLEGASDNKRA